MNSPLLSICCLGYNHAHFLKENLASIAKIDYPNIEVIAIDDGSSDNSSELLHELSKTTPFPLTVIAQENTGNIGKNFNRALAKASGDLVTFIALDDVFNPKVVLSEIHQMIQSENLAFIASTDAYPINDDGFLINTSIHLPLKNKTDVSIQDLLNIEYSHFGGFYIQGSIFRANLVHEIGGFDEDMTGDDIVLRTKLFKYLLNHKGWSFKLIQEPSVFYRLHDNNVHKNTVRQIKIVTEYLNKYWPDSASPPILLNWVESVIKDKPLNESIPIFSMNRRAGLLSKEPRIISAIEKKVLKDNNKFRKIKKFFYKKEKISESIRKITLLNHFSFQYDNKKSNSATKHYSEYF
ncbi:glycosyltransferase family 2 protein [Neisseria montereyensis]|uniref:Glycosyltransferase n=1 Tax=Neisseria montereyensis TaxID=2973938 RepID=A0ABT2FDA5_9NEIS|nr:glycosyltransferase [Neisseria montereyensis]MCS4534146.1 glycosyltransferase [Neisseria montereyensis]